MKFEIRRFLWLLYPVCTVVFMVFGVQTLLKLRTTVEQAISQKTQGETVEERVSKLQAKVTVLTALDQIQADSDLKLLSAGVPPSRQVWSMILGLRQSALDSGALLDSYRVGVGDVRESTASAGIKAAELLRITATFDVEDLAQLASLTTRINQMLPLLRVTKVRYIESTKVDLEIEGAWSAFGNQASQDVMTPLPNYQTLVETLKTRLVGMTDASLITLGTESGVAAGSETIGLF